MGVLFRDGKIERSCFRSSQGNNSKWPHSRLVVFSHGWMCHGCWRLREPSLVPGKSETGLSTSCKEGVRLCQPRVFHFNPGPRRAGRVCWEPTSEEEQRAEGGQRSWVDVGSRAPEKAEPCRQAVLSGNKSKSLPACFSIVPTA